MRGKMRASICLLLLWGISQSEPAGAQIFEESCNDAEILAEGPGGFPARYTIHRVFGEGVGHDEGFTQFGAFLPLVEPCGDSLLFCDLAPLVDDRGNFAANAGLGYRFYSESLQRVFGVYGYFDYRDTDENAFRQGTLGVDSLGTWIDLRGNVYLPGESKKALSTGAAAPEFQGYNLMVGFEQAVPGGEAEIGVVLPELFGIQMRLLGGVYQFDFDDGDDTAGSRVRLESHWTSNIYTDVAVHDDDHFGTTVTVAIGFNWQPESYAPRMPQIDSFRRGPRRHITEHASDRLAEPVHRLSMIVVRTGREQALTPEGDPLNILHVFSEAPAGGDGTFEAPFQTIEQALQEARDGAGVESDIVYTPFGGSYDPTGLLEIPDGLRLLSNAPVQNVGTQLGSVRLPLSGTSPDLSEAPQLTSSVQLGEGAEINGFNILGSSLDPGEEGTVLVNSAANFTVANNRIESWSSGVQVTDSQDGRITGNQIIAAADDGISIVDSDRLDILDNDIEGTIQTAMRIESGGDIQIDSNRIATAADGLLMTDIENSNVNNNRFEDIAGDAIGVTGGELLTISNNQFDQIGGTAIGSDGSDRIAITGNLIGLQTGDGNAVTGDGIRVSGGLSPSITSNQIFRVGGNGISVETLSITEADRAVLSGNILNHIGGNGIDLRGAGFSGTIQSNDVLDAATGIFADVTGAFRGTLDDNIVSNNRARGVDLIAGTFGVDNGAFTIQFNTMEGNTLEGVALLARGAGASTVTVLSNEFIDNNISTILPTVEGREFFMRVEGAGSLNLQLNNNASENAVPAGEFNYDFSRAGAEEITIQITTENIGSIGSSDGSLLFPSP